jgi:Pyridoxamine 5'-phosphate oxidase
MPADANPSRPHIPGYGVPKTRKGLLPWTHVISRMEQSRNYWIITAGADGQPHAVPTWGVWLDDTLYFGGGPDVRWARNLRANPAAAAHLESGDEVVTIEGHVDLVESDSDPVCMQVQDAYETKYGMRHPPPFWVLNPALVLAWSDLGRDATRWILDSRSS